MLSDLSIGNVALKESMDICTGEKVQNQLLGEPVESRPKLNHTRIKRTYSFIRRKLGLI